VRSTQIRPVQKQGWRQEVGESCRTGSPPAGAGSPTCESIQGSGFQKKTTSCEVNTLTKLQAARLWLLGYDGLIAVNELVNDTI